MTQTKQINLVYSKVDLGPDDDGSGPAEGAAPDQ